MITDTADPDSMPIAPGLFTWPSADPRLLGSECTACGAVGFPAAPDCRRCAGATRGVALPATGTLWSWTIQSFLPKAPPYAGPETPEGFRPFGVGYVDLGPVIVESRLTVAEPSALRIGMPMALRVVPFRRDAGRTVVTYAFAPHAGEERA